MVEPPERAAIIPEDEDWDAAIAQCYPAQPPPSLSERLTGRLRNDARRAARRFFPDYGPRSATLSLEWIPASRYRSRWATMRAFALPAFYDGRIRVNLEGREPPGIVPLDDYDATCDELETVLRACLDPRTGEGAVDEIERPGAGRPLRVNDSNADLVVTWKGPVCALVHPEFGLVGPVPFRRTGGHRTVRLRVRERRRHRARRRRCQVGVRREPDDRHAARRDTSGRRRRVELGRVRA